jgi:hypothetical protein
MSAEIRMCAYLPDYRVFHVFRVTVRAAEIYKKWHVPTTHISWHFLK